MNIVPAFIRRRIAHRPNLVKIVDNIGWLFFDKVLRMGVGLLVSVWVARYLGPEQFGLLNFALAFIGLFGAIATLGLQGIVVRDIVRDRESAHLTLGTAAVLQLVGGLVSFLLILVAIAYLRPDDALARTIVAILGAMMLFKASEIALYWFESQVQSKYSVWVQNGVFLVFAAIKVGLILLEAPLTTFVWAMLAEAALVAAMLLLVLNLRGPTKALQASLDRGKTLVKDSWPLILSGLAIMVYMKIDQIMLGQMLGDQAVGIYSAAVRIGEVWYFVPLAVIASVFPAIAKVRKNDSSLYHARFQALYDGVVALALVVALVTSLIAEPFIVLLYGSDYADGGSVLAVLVWSGVFASLSFASGRWYLLEGLQKLALSRNLFGVAINVALNFVLIPRYGALGAAFSTLAAQCCAAFLFDVFNPRTRDVFFMKLNALLLLGLFRRLFAR